MNCDTYVSSHIVTFSIITEVLLCKYHMYHELVIPQCHYFVSPPSLGQAMNQDPHQVCMFSSLVITFSSAMGKVNKQSFKIHISNVLFLW